MRKYFILFFIALLVAIMATANVALKSVSGPAPKADFAEQQRRALENARPSPNAPRPDAVFTPADKFRDEGDTLKFL